MPKIFLIGTNILKKDYEDALSHKDFEVSKFRSIDNALPRIDDKVNLIISEKEQGKSKSFQRFLKTALDIPKLIISSDYSNKGFGVWLKDSVAYPIYKPSAKELLYFIKKILKDNSARIENKKLQESLAVAKKEILFFEEVGKTLTSSLDLNEILTAIMKKTKEITNADTWSVFLADQETGDIVFEKSDNKKASKIGKYRLKLGEGIAGWVAKEGIPVIVPDVSRDPRLGSGPNKKAYLKTKSLMCVPIKSQGAVIGVLEVINKTKGKQFTKEDLDLLMRLIDQAALAIERSALYQKMEELALTDDLTKLFNTRYLNRTIDMEIQRSNRHHSSISLIFIDIDYFKDVNDQYGHLVGSKMLVEMGQLILKNLRSIDIVARYGGDEFVVVLPQTSAKSAIQIAERIRASVEQNVFLKKEGYSLKVTASFGIASYPENAKSKEELLRLADEAMYKVKYTTRNGVYAIV